MISNAALPQNALIIDGACCHRLKRPLLGPDLDPLIIMIFKGSIFARSAPTIKGGYYYKVGKPQGTVIGVLTRLSVARRSHQKDCSPILLTLSSANVDTERAYDWRHLQWIHMQIFKCLNFQKLQLVELCRFCALNKYLPADDMCTMLQEK